MNLRRSLHLNDEAGGGSGDPAANAGGQQDADLGLTELDKKFLGSKGIAVDKLGSDPVEMGKAIRLLAAESAGLVKSKAELEKENRQLKRAPNRDVVQPDGSVDSDALATLQTNAGKAGDMDGLIDMLYERGQIEEKAYKLLKAGDPKEVASAMKYMELLGGTAPAGGDSSEVAELKKQVAHLTSLFGDAGVLSDASQGADPALTDENELAKLGLRPKLDMGLSDMEKIQKDREKQRAEAVRQVRNFR